MSLNKWIQKSYASSSHSHTRSDKKLVLICGEKRINILVTDSENDPSGFIFKSSTFDIIEGEVEKMKGKKCQYKYHNFPDDQSIDGILNQNKLNSNQNLDLDFRQCEQLISSAFSKNKKTKKKCFRLITKWNFCFCCCC